MLSVTCSEPEHPLRQLDADLARAEHGAIGLLQHQAEAPGRQQRIERALVEMPYQHPFHQHSQRAGCDEGQDHRQEEVAAEQARQIGLEEIRGHPGDVGPEDHELAMGHVDDAHLAEDDRKPERHQDVDREQDQSRKALHDEDGAKITKRIVAEHRCPPSGIGPASRAGSRRGGLGRGLAVHARERLDVEESARATSRLTGSPWGTDPARRDRRSRRSARTGHRAWRVPPGSSTRGDGFRGCGHSLPAHP